jgi:predicted O-methyltransferase YrrM
MSTSPEWHDKITESIGGKENYGKGIWPNPWTQHIEEYKRRSANNSTRHMLTRKIMMLTEPRFITGSETSELLESLSTMIDARNILEIGMHTGRTTLHLLRSIVGKENAKVISIDARPTHDQDFFSHPSISPFFQFIKGWTPECFSILAGKIFDLVFVDSDHSLEHTKKEVEALKPLIRTGSIVAFHDCPEWRTPTNKDEYPVRIYLKSLIEAKEFRGIMLPSPRQLDCQEEWGKDYPIESSPGMAILVRR